ncbi:unnamed protein product [Caenorhabditis auriculariae]|uniref:E3 ubiquitin-protein ligase listerin n=1 Tax=Caenorhabditis auriculariae TaxID=2777116 RepID=A0A8S1GMF7_9PELO|nr:unnamed protein product [Caenorhabditis auriculariae]
MSKANRRKGNAKTASSSAAASYLGDGASKMNMTPEMNIFDVVDPSIEPQNEIDAEVKIVLRKLSKKDAHTREKGLRELLELLQGSDQSSMEIIYEHFTSAFDRLATDGSPTVRLLTIRTLGLFITKLQKAASKGLKRSMPFLMFALSDMSNSVCSQADAVFKDNFDGEKRIQAFKVFAANTIDMAVEIVFGVNDITLPTKYDDEESPEQRLHRLTSQALGTIQKLANKLKEQPELWEKSAAKLFSEGAKLQKLLAGQQTNIKIGLLSICLYLPEKVHLITNSPLCAWVMASLDSSDEAVCSVAWEAFVNIVAEKSFYEKNSLKKSTIPRILNVVRKKESHWKRMAHYLLPATSLLYNVVREDGGEEAASHFLASLLESFLDRLPFPASAPPLTACEWANSFGELIQWSLGQVPQSSRLISKLCVTLMVKACEATSRWANGEVAQKLASLICRVLGKSFLDMGETQELCQILEFNINCNRELNENLCRELLMNGKCLALCDLHSSVLRHPLPPPFFAFQTLLNSEDKYLSKVLTQTDFFRSTLPTSQWSKEQAKVIVKLIERIIGLKSPETPKFELGNDAFCRELISVAAVAKTKGNPQMWDSFGKNVSLAVLEKMLDSWKSERNGTDAALLLDAISRDDRANFSGNLMNKVSSHDGRFIGEFLQNSVHLDDSTRSNLSNILFRAIITDPRSNEIGEAAKVLAKFPPSGNVLEEFPQFLNEAISSDHTDIEVSEVCDLLFDELAAADEFSKKDVVSRMLSNPSKMEKLLKSFDFLNVDVLSHSSLIAGEEEFSAIASCSLDLTEELMLYLSSCLRVSVVNLSISNDHVEDNAHGMAALLLTVVEFVVLRRPSTLIEEELRDRTLLLKEKINLDLALRSLVGFFARRHDNTSFLLLKTLSSLICLSNSELLHDDELSQCSTVARTYLGMNDRISELSDAADLLLRFKNDSSLLFLEHLQALFQDGSEPELFCAKDDDHFLWMKNILWLRAWENLNSSLTIFEVEDEIFIDFMLCGLVTMIDSLNDLFQSGASYDMRIEALASLALRIFVRISRVADAYKVENVKVTEWKEFYAEAIMRTILPWCSLLLHGPFAKKRLTPSPFVFSLMSAIELIRVSEFLPESVEVPMKYIPELESFNYSDGDHSLISAAFQLLRDGVVEVQMIGVHLAKMLMPDMFTKENKENITEEAGEDTVLPKKDSLRVPIMLSKAIDELAGSSKWTLVMLLDVALTPLTSGLSDEVRMGYSDALTPVLNCCLPTLFTKLQTCSPTVRDFAGIEKNQTSTDFYGPYASQVLYRVLSIVPAAFRIWYKSLPTNAATIVRKRVKPEMCKSLIDNELQKVKAANRDLKKDSADLKIRVVPVSGEVFAEYTVEETTMKLSIRMPADYPLAVPTVELDNAIVRSDRAKRWLLQLTVYLVHQNGSIVDGVLMWRRNVDRDVEGAETCTICMMIVHSTTHQMPKVKCRQCKNKFHSNCLYKWFESSNQSSCPLCRANFTGH